MPMRRRAALIAAACVALVSCTEGAPQSGSRPTITAPTSPSAGLLDGVLGTLIGVNGVTRTTPLASSITVSKVIGGDGGTIAIPDAGVTVTIPRGALIGPTTIVMTARAGSLVAYDFEPHGIVFAKPLVFSQKLSGTSVGTLQALSLRLGYYTDPSLLTATGGLVSQLIGGATNLLTWTFTAPIPHFSGYMVACDRSE